jgi:hypothetical protein
MALKWFKKSTGYVVTYDPKVHKAEYLEHLKSKFEECKEDGSSLKEKVKKSKKKKGVKDGK